MRLADWRHRRRRGAHDARIRGPLAAIYGDEACLFKDKLIFKPPGAKGYALHQDFMGWNGFPESFVTVLVPIDAADEENGCTEVFPGYHRQGCLSPCDGEYHGVDQRRGRCARRAGRWRSRPRDVGS